jgi:hypothetical protein
MRHADVETSASRDRKRQTAKGQPMVRFTPAQQLKDKYHVFGHFYSVRVAATKVVDCRSVLEIVEKPHAQENTSVLSRSKPDAVFIMMNPGSSLAFVAETKAVMGSPNG